MSSPPLPLKDRLRADLTAAIKGRDKVRAGTIRMVLSAISEAEVAGTQAVQLSEQQVLDVVVREAKKRREAEDAYVAADRPELAEKEHAESAVLADYLPQQLTPDELTDLVRQAIAETGAAELGMRGMGKAMGYLTSRTKGKADGAAVAAEVKRQLAAGS
ncbi:MAG TPA: GatB/YqeY domain-containing protein [Propionibacteriaceae bacterium]|nr:GatB/YqeY domain-containing protein [Propionibacteriaceae bacterium]